MHTDSAVPTAKLDVCDIKFQAANTDSVICHFVRKVTQASLSREGDRVSGGRSFLGIKLLNFILHAYSFSRVPRQRLAAARSRYGSDSPQDCQSRSAASLPRGGSLSLNSTFHIQKQYKSVVGTTPYDCLLQWEKVSPSGDG